MIYLPFLEFIRVWLQNYFIVYKTAVQRFLKKKKTKYYGFGEERK